MRSNNQIKSINQSHDLERIDRARDRTRRRDDETDLDPPARATDADGAATTTETTVDATSDDGAVTTER